MTVPFVAAPRAFHVTSTLVPTARPPSLKLISVREALVGVLEAWAVLPWRPMFARAPLGSCSLPKGWPGAAASIKGELSAARSSTKLPVVGS